MFLRNGFIILTLCNTDYSAEVYGDYYNNDGSFNEYKYEKDLEKIINKLKAIIDSVKLPDKFNIRIPYTYEEGNIIIYTKIENL